ncbi:metallophosphoesterase [Riemerella anatipestifer]|nr:metallophosphoesterase [Riemerella anatipestifer]MDY3326019.1 metallophosphoesterase [Riemerella anatipestifer]MDY3352432.1 metallophosphoesterase [Riemerella anatipestifer]MDY3529343.1 metallophosphoesterase [Riemerella anatipestifer]
MKQPLTIQIFKILKIVTITIISSIIIFLLVFGINIEYEDGRHSTWSGLRVLFEDRDFELCYKKKHIVKLNGFDGPYIIDSTMYYVDSLNILRTTRYKKNDSILVRVNNKDLDKFYFSKKTIIQKNADSYVMPQKLIAISDIEGNFDAFSSFLINNKVVDTNYNWIFGNGHLVLTGDFVDRGTNVTAVLWLIYKLEEQSEKQGGKVHYILGNHEIINFQGRFKYNNEKYIKVASLISKTEDWKKATQYMFSEKTELGKWLRSKNGIEKIGNYIFVHAGLSPNILKYNLSISDINGLSQQNWFKDLYNKPENDEKANFLIGREGIFWYRGLAIDYKHYNKISETELNKVLNFYQAKKIVFGHTISDNIKKEYNGKLINIDVAHGQEKNSDKTKGLLIESGNEYIIDGKGKKSKL